jgi:hypothetical protein
MHTFTGLLICGTCGDDVRAKRSGKKQVYLCPQPRDR